MLVMWITIIDFISDYPNKLSSEVLPEPYRYEPGPEVITEDDNDDVVIGDNFDDGIESLQYQRDLYIDEKGKYILHFS